jgi:hypothetical protein
MLLACAAAEHYHEAFMQAARVQVTERARQGHMEAQALYNVSWAFAKFHYYNE